MVDIQQTKIKKQSLFDELCNSELAKNFPKTDYILVNTSDVLPSTYDDFYDEYASMFKTTLTVLQPIEDRIKECETTMNEYTNLFFKQDDDDFIPMTKVPRSFSISLDDMDKLDPNSELTAILKRRKQIFLTVSSDENEIERKTIESLSYKPFQPNVYNDWASETTVEVIDILNKVTNAQKFKGNFPYYWNKIIHSDTSQHLLVDTFWWFYLKYFKKQFDVDEECNKYFGRISKNYVELLLSVDPWFRDKFFNIYAPYLSQAVYQTFFDTCPDSRMNLTDKFKEFVANTISEWISGTQATAESYKNWKIRADSTMITSDNAMENSSSSNDILKKILHLEEELEALGGDSGDETTRSAVTKASSATPRKNTLSNFNGSAQIENEPFGLSNQSTLVAQFLDQCDIQPNTPRLRNINRMHIKGWSADK
ncbi:unnamed protein product [Rotaria socialis]|uniref:Protein FAM227B n=2 Tax=Rotaria socialis TaxID=392032 RepID=A0A817YVK5_9BILA|nr:unnamed protein product [Rotaria socialis]CAF3375184.1 unnamed protein product [Rotaria socialis]CAF3383015.1 unnamed protein product [Rotaria socialis]CAF3495562.1 unnamed protein product [Rotaria socialis]CAF4173038.1 unnamed protein product [Rotaria socialis]